VNISSKVLIEEEIQTRIRLYDYSTGKQTFFQWQAGMLPSMSDKKVLELGCGDGALWHDLMPRWASCDLTLTDISAEIISVAKESLAPIADTALSIQFDIVDFNQLDYEDGSFDVVIANHNLFYADDIQGVLASISRVLSPNGVLICSTIGKDHLHELVTILRSQENNLPWGAEHWAECFGLENGGESLMSQFLQVDQYEYDNNLHVNAVEPVMSYLMKTMKKGLSSWVSKNEDDIRALLSSAIDDNGYMRLTPHSGFFVARKSA